MSILRACLVVVTMMGGAILGSMTVTPGPAAAQAVETIVVEGNRRVEAETVRSYFTHGAGGRLDQGTIDEGLKALIATGLFQDVKISRTGARLTISVVENPVIGRVAFEGNKKIKDEQLSAEIQSKPRGTLSRPMVQSDSLRIAEIYRRSGRYDVRVTPEIIEQPNNRVDLSSRSWKASRPGSSRSSSSATARSRPRACATSSRPMNRICSAFSATTTSTTPTGSRPIAT